jgi:hypothetical protein
MPALFQFNRKGVRGVGEIDSLLIERACERVALSASHALDVQDVALLKTCFTEDCTFVRPSTYPHDPVVGRDALISLVRARDPRYVGRHVITNMRVSVVDQTSAVASSLFCNFAGKRDPLGNHTREIASVLRSIGEYEDAFALCNGRWQISRRVGRFVFGDKFSP